MNTATRSAREAQSRRFYAPDYRRRLRDAGTFSTLSASANVVLAALCDRANAAGVAWPAVETMARDYGLGESTVRRALGELVALGLVLAVRRAGKVSRYVLTTPKMGTGMSFQGAEDDVDPSRIGPPPLSNRAPIMTRDHDQDHQKQHDSAASGVVVVVDDLSNEELAAATPPADRREMDVDMIALLTPDLVDRAREIGLAPAKVNRYGAERVRGVLDALEAERARKVIGNPAGWAMKALAEDWELTGTARQCALPIASIAVAAARPPEGTRWAREKETGVKLEVFDVNDTRAQLAGGVAVPAHRWDAWEWFIDRDGQVLGAEDDGGAVTVADDAAAVEKRGALAWVAAWATIRSRTSIDLEAKLEAAGLTFNEWVAYRAAENRA